MLPQSTLPDNYWSTLKTEKDDFSFLFNHLLECETPLTTAELVQVLVKERIAREKENFAARQKSAGEIYYPKNQYKVGDSLAFLQFDGMKGKIQSIRPGKNPEYPPFEVMQVKMDDGSMHSLASGLETHALNDLPTAIDTDANLDLTHVLDAYGAALITTLEQAFLQSPDLVRIAGRWFPKSLLVDVNAGHLNLAEATLDMADGGPLPTSELQKQVELTSDVNVKLLEFSLNYALQEDHRFDEVGPAGEVVWFLHRCEPSEVQETPLWLRYTSSKEVSPALPAEMQDFCARMADELDDFDGESLHEDEVVLPLLYPHWRAGTLPLNHINSDLFPTAYESPRIQFSFINGNTQEQYTGWVVRSSRYVYGLKAFYDNEGMIPGSVVHIRRGQRAGEVIIHSEKSRSNREWIRTALVGADGGVVYALLKQPVTTTYDERMAIVIPDVDALDALWNTPPKIKGGNESLVLQTLRNLAKLNPQGHVHAQELYSALNIMKRLPPSVLMGILSNHEQIKHIGDFYFRVEDSDEEGNP